MKKLSLKSLNFGSNELLKREQLKTVFGGYGDMCPENSCSSSSQCGGNFTGCYNYYCTGTSGPTFKQCGY